MPSTTLRMLLYVICLLAMVPSSVAQTGAELLILDAQTPRQVITAYSQDQTIHFQHLQKGATYQLVVPPDLVLGSCRPQVMLVESTAQLVDHQSDEHLLRFVATSSIAQIKLLYPCNWDPSDPPRHYISISCLSCDSKKPEPGGQADAAVLQVQSSNIVELIRNVLIGGNCLDVQNVTISGNANQIGKFSQGASNIGFDQGMIMCTGDFQVAPGPNTQNGAGGGGAVSSDLDLASIATGNLFDAAIIEFDFTPTKTPFTFSYAFASEEYCEYVSTSFNDVFGFFISGPGIVGTKNLAVVPSSTTPVSLNTINHITNAGFYTANTPPGLDNCENGGVCACLPPQTPATGIPTQELQYDGFTKSLTATTPVIPCNTYHIKLAIADVADGVWDSAVFLKAGSFGGSTNASLEWVVNGQQNVNQVGEASCPVQILVDRGGANPALPLPVTFTISGTATSGTDFSSIPNTIVIPAGQEQVLYTVNINNDMVPEGAETIILTLNNTCSCLNPQKTLVITDVSAVTAVADTVTVCGTSGFGTVGVAATGGVAPYSYQWSTGANTQNMTAFVSQSTSFTVTVTDACGLTKTAVARINLTPYATAQLLPPAPQLCPGHQAVIMVNFTGQGPWVFSYSLNGVPQPPIQGITDDTYALPVSLPGLYQYGTLVDGFGCPGIGSGGILVTNSSLSITGVVFDATAPGLANGSINTTVTGGQGPYSYVWQGPSSIGNIADPFNILPGAYTVTVTDGFGCSKVQSFSVGPLQAPWTFETTGINHTIILPAGLLSDVQGTTLQPGDQIGLFFESAGTYKCGGFGIWPGSGSASAFAVYGNDAVAPAKNGFNLGEPFLVKIWRSNMSPQELDATAVYAPVGSLGIVTHTNSFATDGISMINSITAGTTHSVILKSGWNMISSYVTPTLPNMVTVFSSIASSIDIVKDGDGNACLPAVPINGIGNWNLLKGYQVKTNVKDTLLVVGQKAVPEANPIPLHPGWQIIGYLRDSPLNIVNVFAPIQAQVSLVKDNLGKTYLPQLGAGTNTIGDMKPGQGYKVYALSNATLTYPANYTGQQDERSNLTDQHLEHFELSPLWNTGNNATLILADSIVRGVLQSGDEIGIFTPEGLLCGAAKYQQGAPLAMTVWGDDISTDALKEGLQMGEAYHFKVWNAVGREEYSAMTTTASGIPAYEPDAIEWITSMHLASVGMEELTTVGIQTLQLFPNPASESLNIRIRSEQQGKVVLTVLRQDGMRVADPETLEYGVGNTPYTWRTPVTLPAGIYWFKFQFDKGMVYRQVFIQE